jgi:hypothetical protein
MATLGDIIYLHHRRNHPRFGALGESNEVTAILELLHTYGASPVEMASDNNLKAPQHP